MADVDIDNILPENALIEDLGADSLNVVELVMAVEESFGLEIDEEEARTLLTVKDIIDFIHAKSKTPDHFIHPADI